MRERHNQKKDEKDSEREDGQGAGIHSDKKVVCPVCGKVLKDQLPSKTSIFEENIPFEGRIRIVDSELTLECIFDHCTDEEDDDLWLENPHAVKAVIKAVLNGEGECTQFEITEIHPG
jgi:C4-type Zn-finger protein